MRSYIGTRVQGPPALASIGVNDDGRTYPIVEKPMASGVLVCPENAHARSDRGRAAPTRESG